MRNPEQMEIDDELLTAYLDDEISESEKEMVRARLVREPDLSKRLGELQRAWDALDDFLQVEAGDEFTRSTLELLTAKLSGPEDTESLRQSSVFSLTFKRFWPVLLVFCSALLGSIVGNVTRISKDRNQLRELVLISNLPGLKVASELASQPADLESIIRTVTSVPNWKILVDHQFQERILPEMPRELDRRESWLAELTNDQKGIMWRRHREWSRIPSEQRSALTSVQKQIANEADPELARQVLTVASEILESMPDNERGMFQSLPRDEQLARLRELCCMSVLDWYLLEWDSDEPVELAQLEYQNLEEWLDKLPPFLHEQFRRMGWFANQPSWENLLSPTLSAEVRELFASLKDKDRSEKFRNWFMLLNRNVTIGRISEKASFEAYLNSDAARRELMDLRSPADIQRMLMPQIARPNRPQATPPSPQNDVNSQPRA